MSANEISLRVNMALELFPDLDYEFDWNRIDFRAYKGMFDFLWMETKRQKTDPFIMLAQLFLTAKPIFDKGHLPPKFFCVIRYRNVSYRLLCGFIACIFGERYELD